MLKKMANIETNATISQNVFLFNHGHLMIQIISKCKCSA